MAEIFLFRFVCVTTIGVCIFRCVQLRLCTPFYFGGKKNERKRHCNIIRKPIQGKTPKHPAPHISWRFRTCRNSIYISPLWQGHVLSSRNILNLEFFQIRNRQSFNSAFYCYRYHSKFCTDSVNQAITRTPSQKSNTVTVDFIVFLIII